jgi:hypothetical protein
MPTREHAEGDVGRLRRFESQRFIGARDTMVVYDCDDDEQFAEIETRIAEDDLLDHNLVQTFGPDSLPEARNRGFTPRR